jgi:hypothetical protein
MFELVEEADIDQPNSLIDKLICTIKLFTESINFITNSEKKIYYRIGVFGILIILQYLFFQINVSTVYSLLRFGIETVFVMGIGWLFMKFLQTI